LVRASRKQNPEQVSRIGLIACSSKKASGTNRASNIYTSQLFKKARRFAERFCDSWYILSAKHGLLSPNRTIQPYDCTLNRMSGKERVTWAKGTFSSLENILRSGDQVTLLAGSRYRQHLAGLLQNHGVLVDTPLKGLPIGRQLQWLQVATEDEFLMADYRRFYQLLARLSEQQGFPRLGDCSGQMPWPERGVYFFFEDEERRRIDSWQKRVVRIGTHAVSKGSKSRLWTRLRTHLGTSDSSGNHRSSVFRLHVGAALIQRSGNGKMKLPYWGYGQTASEQVRKSEQCLERQVSAFISQLTLVWIAVGDPAGPGSDRAYLERNAIGLLTSSTIPLDYPTSHWLGKDSPRDAIRRSGLWNLDYIGCGYDRRFLDVLETYVDVTLGQKPPQPSIAPKDWLLAARKGAKPQLALFED
jgi:Family of unknown function (DUF6884)